MKCLKKVISALLLACCATTFAQKGTTMKLWPNAPEVVSSDDKDEAEVTVYLPDAKKATGRAVVCCPGGGYQHLAMDHEGHQWAAFFNTQGIALIVLKYRMPHGNRLVPISDAEEAMKLVRRNAAEWHINPNDVGIMGFSAGGHLASTIATHSKGDAAPNFQILFYPVITMDPGFTHMGSHDNLLGKELSKKEMKKLEVEYSNDLQVNRTTPRAFLALSDDDKAVPAANGFNYYQQLYKHDVPASIHIYPTGGHGWGYRETFAFHYEMVFELKAWLKSFLLIDYVFHRYHHSSQHIPCHRHLAPNCHQDRVLLGHSPLDHIPYSRSGLHSWRTIHRECHHFIDSRSVRRFCPLGHRRTVRPEAPSRKGLVPQESKQKILNLICYRKHSHLGNGLFPRWE